MAGALPVRFDSCGSSNPNLLGELAPLITRFSGAVDGDGHCAYHEHNQNDDDEVEASHRFIRGSFVVDG